MHAVINTLAAAIERTIHLGINVVSP